MNYRTPEYREKHTAWSRQKYGHKPRTYFPESFWNQVQKSDGCWEWTGFITPAGYGRNGQRGLSHRIAYELLVGKIPAGLTLDHLCRNRKCCNPEHLEPVSYKINILRGIGRAAKNKAKTHCIKGHPFSEYGQKRNDGGRNCIICKRERGKLWMRKYRGNRA